MMSKAWRPIWILTLMSLLCLGAVVGTLRAVAQEESRPPPSAPEETATIVDDPVVAPDPAESADNNITFPVDI